MLPVAGLKPAQQEKYNKDCDIEVMPGAPA